MSNFSKVAELHCHSKSNRLFYAPFLYDSVQTVSEIIAKSVELNISIIAISDHDSLDGYRKAKFEVEKNEIDILLVPSTEVSSSAGHILAYGVEKVIEPNKSPKYTIEAIHDQGGIAVAAHPFTVLGVGKKVFDLNFDAIEGFNSTIPNFCNRKAQLAAESLDLPCLAGSDAHQAFALGNGRTIFRDNVRTASDLISAIKRSDFGIDYKRTPLMPMIAEHLKKSLEFICN